MHDGSLAAFHDLEPRVESFRDAVLAGLSRTPKEIPCRFFYDEAGARLFETICELPEYYPTRTELGLLARHAPEIARLAGPGARLIEFGSGSSRKVRLLLDALEDPACYVAIDISREHLLAASDDLAAQFPGVAVAAVCADYTRPFELPPLTGSGKRLGFFPGSTIGNFTPPEAATFLIGCRRLLGPDAEMLVGVDLKKEPAVLHAAYNDAAGVTAAFNLNLLTRINRELQADFDRDRFAHVAFFNTMLGRIEMHLESRAEQDVTVAGRSFRFARGERIHTENSYKYGIAEFHEVASAAGFRPVAVWTDPDRRFSLHYLAC